MNYECNNRFECLRIRCAKHILNEHKDIPVHVLGI